MNINYEQINLAKEIDKKIRKLEKKNCNEVDILVKMYDYMPKFKKIMDTTSKEGMDQLCAQFKGFYRYAKILDTLAEKIASGEIIVPR